jgi:hypothetical protein
MMLAQPYLLRQALRPSPPRTWFDLGPFRHPHRIHSKSGTEEAHQLHSQRFISSSGSNGRRARSLSGCSPPAHPYKAGSSWAIEALSHLRAGGQNIGIVSRSSRYPFRSGTLS